MEHTEPQHEIIFSALLAVKGLVQGKSFQSAAQRLGEWRLQLERRLDTEGRLVPIFISRTGDPRGLVTRLKREHDELMHDLDCASNAITRWNENEALSALEQLTCDYRAHLATEAEMLHPALDDFAPDDFDWDALHHQLLNADSPHSN